MGEAAETFVGCPVSGMVERTCTRVPASDEGTNRCASTEPASPAAWPWPWSASSWSPAPPSRPPASWPPWLARLRPPRARHGARRRRQELRAEREPGVDADETDDAARPTGARDEPTSSRRRRLGRLRARRLRRRTTTRHPSSGSDEDDDADHDSSSGSDDEDDADHDSSSGSDDEDDDSDSDSDDDDDSDHDSSSGSDDERRRLTQDPSARARWREA